MGIMERVAKVFITRAFPFDALKRLRAEHEVDVWDDNAPPPRDVLLERAAQADALLTIITERVDAELFDAAPSVKAVANLAVGTDNIDLDEAAKRGIGVGNTPGVLTDATADIAFALLLAIARRITEGDRQVREGGWAPWHPSHMLGGDLAQTTLGIIGWGRIGQAMARRGEGFGMKIIHSSRSSGIALEALLEQADHVSLHTPLTDETRHLMGAAQFKRMKDTAYFVNTSRGGTVDQAALTRALHEGQIAGAGLDVTDPEPLPSDDPLLQAPNLVVVPHVGSPTVRTRSRMADMAVDNLLAALAGEEMPHRAA
jgi:glyoxylate reductase